MNLNEIRLIRLKRCLTILNLLTNKSALCFIIETKYTLKEIISTLNHLAGLETRSNGYSAKSWSSKQC